MWSLERLQVQCELNQNGGSASIQCILTVSAIGCLRGATGKFHSGDHWATESLLEMMELCQHIHTIFDDHQTVGSRSRTFSHMMHGHYTYSSFLFDVEIGRINRKRFMTVTVSQDTGGSNGDDRRT